jgi:hypothetical protein
LGAISILRRAQLSPPNADTQFSHIFYVWYVKVADMNERALLPMRGGPKWVKHIQSESGSYHG